MSEPRATSGESSELRALADHGVRKGIVSWLRVPAPGREARPHAHADLDQPSPLRSTSGEGTIRTLRTARCCKRARLSCRGSHSRFLGLLPYP
jgi:hypothetical protein